MAEMKAGLAHAGTGTQEGTSTEESGGSALLDQIISATKQTEPKRARDLVETFVEEALQNTVKFDKNLTRTIQAAVGEIDRLLSTQLNQIMHHPRFLKLEGSWRGLKHLVSNTETGSTLKLKVLNAAKTEIARDLGRAVEFDQSHLFKTIYEDGFGVAGGEPFGALIGDYEWDATSTEVETLQLIAGVAATSFAPFISAAAPQMFGIDSWTKLNKTRDLETIFDGTEHTLWREFRESPDARYVSLVLPRVLARVPYGKGHTEIEGFRYEETPLLSEAPGKAGISREMPHDHYCWMNAAYAMAGRLTAAFTDYGFCTTIRGEESGGKVSGLPLHNYLSDAGDRVNKCPTEINITDRRDPELGRLGFLPIVHYKNTASAVFYGAQTIQKPIKYDREEINANAEIMARLPYVMATSRFAHYLKVLARGKIGSFQEAADCENKLNRWIMNYVNGNPTVSEDMKAKFPLREARVEVQEVEGQPGVYNAVAFMRPWLQMEELTASLRMVARIPKRI